MITATEFKAKFAEFTSVDDTLIDLYISEAALMFGPCWGVKAPIGLGYLVAHTLALDLKTSQGSGGMVTSEKVGDLQRNYGQFSLTLGEWAATPYGLSYQRMLKSLKCSPRVL